MIFFRFEEISYKTIFNNLTTYLRKKIYLGGSATNTAEILTNLLNKSNLYDKYATYLIGVIGNDENGRIVKHKLKNLKTNTDFIGIFQGSTGKTHIHLDKDRERKITRFKSVNKLLARHINKLKIQKILSNPEALIHIKGEARVFEKTFQAKKDIFSADISGIIGKAEFSKFKNLFKDEYIDSVNIYDKVKKNKTKNMQKRKPSIKILFGNEKEFGQILSYMDFFSFHIKNFREFEKKNEIQQASLIRILMKNLGSKISCVKKGKKGALAITQEEYLFCKSLPVKVADTTGAGDAFNAGFIFGYLSRKNLRDALSYACKIGSFNCQKYGGH